jgi:transglutaminase-like putative cysteine protease
MSMDQKRPQLSHDELLQLRWLLGGIAALTGAWSVVIFDQSAVWLLGLCTLAVSLVIWKPALPARVPAWLHKLALPAILAFAAYDFYSEGEVLPALTQMALMLLTYRAVTYRRRRDELQLVVLGLFLVVVAGVLTVPMGFAVQILAFTGLALSMLMAMTLSEAAGVKPFEAGRAPTWAERAEWRRLFKKLRAAADWRILALGGVLFAGLAVVSGLLFLAIPRFELGNSLFLEGLMKRNSSSGFTDTLKFGDVTQILRDDSVAMRVEVDDRAAVPKELYWRMVVMDEYRDRAFRLSPGLKAAAFERAATLSSVRGGETSGGGGPRWRFYVEPGVGRYVPLTGAFGRLHFSEPQTIRKSGSLRVIELTREPVSMKAYQVNGMKVQQTLRDPEFARWIGLSADERRARAPNRPTLLETELTEADRARLADLVKEIAGGADLTAEAFSRKAQAWLGERHGYSLSPNIPVGTGDPVVRWLVSNEPGHCELFAGAFTLLARAAGHPTRAIGGFVGGGWNGDYLIVRNSNAHAWCEIFDGTDSWLRVDPTASAGRGGANGLDALMANAGLRDEEGGWGAAMDRMRLFWYRRIVNFDRSDQQALTATFTGAGKILKGKAREYLERVKAWLAKPWSGERIVWIICGGAALAGLWFAWRRKGRASWLRWRSAHGVGRIDPVRKEAGKWLRKLPKPMSSLEPQHADLRRLREELERVRYGPKESWPATARLWREARGFYRKSRAAGRLGRSIK